MTESSFHQKPGNTDHQTPTHGSDPEADSTHRKEDNTRHESHNEEQHTSDTFSLRTGVYHIKGTGSIRLVRNHRYKKGMFEVFEFHEEKLSDQTKNKIRKKGGCRDVSTEWYKLVKEAEATRHELFRRNPGRVKECSWDDWTRFASRYIPLKTCTSCGNSFRTLQPEKELCADCSGQIIDAVDREIDAFRETVKDEKKLPKGSWQELQQFRDKVDTFEKDKNISRTKLKKVKDKLHSIYRSFIEQRRVEQDEYRKLHDEMEKTVDNVVKRSLESTSPSPPIIEELKRIRNRLHHLSDRKNLGMRDFRKLMDKLHKASKHEEEKFEKHKKEQQERLQKWEDEEKKLDEAISAVEIGVDFSQENWQALLDVKEQIAAKQKSGAIGNKGKKRLLVLVNHLLDQENILREMSKLETHQKRKVHKESSQKTAHDFKKTLQTMNIGLGYSQELWNELVALQRKIIQEKNEGGLSISDFKDVMEVVNEKLDTLKKLRSWSQ